MAARAEARRRRILENSVSRLARISGRDPEAEKLLLTASPDDCYLHLPSKPVDFQEEAPAFEANHVIFPDVDEILLNEETHQPQTFVQDEPQANIAKAPPLRRTFTSTLLNAKIPIFLCAILVQVIFTFNKVTNAYLFIPLVAWQLIEYLFFPQERSILDSVLPLLGISIEKVNLLIQIVKFTMRFMEDAFLYLFTFIMVEFFVYYAGLKR